MGTIWVNIGTPNLTGSGSQTPAISPDEIPPYSPWLERVLDHVMWVSLAAAVLSLLMLGAVIAARMRAGEGVMAVGRVGMVLSAVVLMSSASALVSGAMPPVPRGAGGATLFLQSALWWYTGAAAVLSVLVGGARMAWEQRAEPGREVLRSLLTLVVVAGSGVTLVGVLVRSADRFSTWIIDSSVNCTVSEEGSTCFGDNMLALLALGSGAAGGLGPLLIIILGLMAVLASAFQVVLMVARGGMLVILTGILPLSASFTNTEMGRNWFRKCVAWLVAFILYKPAAAVVYAAAFQLAGTDVFSDDGSGFLSVLTGLMLMVIALFAMPALMRFVTPMVGAVAGGAAGGAAVGALAALPTGAAAVGRLASGSGSSSQPSHSLSAPSGAASSGADGRSGASGESGAHAAGPSGGGHGGGQAAGAGAQDQSRSSEASQSGRSGAPGAGTGGTSGAAGAAPGTTPGTGSAAASAGGGAGTGGTGGAAVGGSTGAAAGSGAAAAGGAAGSGAAAGSGGAAAAGGAAGGPVGVAAGAALEAGKKAGQAAAGAVRAVGEQATGQATGEEGGPSGSR
ncbi:hypothetical protein [Actinomyces sp. 2119]|uniref:hypothetical protein n=1 Tax=Actinomyces sp. 2119 TaxID=2321393 RepID=UPI001C720636|nr:hypothetical protein [Actinomyces sp. 2119]